MPAQQSAPTSGKSSVTPQSPPQGFGTGSGKLGAQHTSPTPVKPPQAPGMIALTQGQRMSVSPQGGAVNGAAKPGFPIYSPMAQGYHGASGAQQNPNLGGASSSPSALTNPSTTRGGMGQ